MLKILNLNEIQNVPYPALRGHLEQKVQEWKNEYNIENLTEIGCFLVLDKSENQMFEASEMEFVEVLKIKNEIYLHGAKITGDSFGEDTYLLVEVVVC